MRALAVLFLLACLPVAAQMQETVHADAYSSPAAASFAMTGYLGSENVDLLPARIYSPFFGVTRTQYALLFQPVAGELEECGTFPGTAPPPATAYTDACGTSHTLEGWVVRTHSTPTLQRNWYNFGLSDLQRGSAFVLTDPANVTNPYLVVYRTELPSNYHCP